MLSSSLSSRVGLGLEQPSCSSQVQSWRAFGLPGGIGQDELGDLGSGLALRVMRILFVFISTNSFHFSDLLVTHSSSLR